MIRLGFAFLLALIPGAAFAAAVLDYNRPIYTDQYALLCENLGLDLETVFLSYAFMSAAQLASVGCREITGEIPVYNVKRLPKSSADAPQLVELSLQPNLPATWVTVPSHLRN